MKIILLLLLLTGCGKVTVAPQFQPYLDSFLAEGRARGQDYSKSEVTINFGSVSSGERAYCSRYTFQANEVIVGEGSWNGMNEDRRTALIYHELGHCILNRPHRDEMSYGRAVSLMNSKLISSSQFHKYQVEYIDELFSK